MKTLILLILGLLFFSCAKNEVLLLEEEVEPIRIGRNDFIGDIRVETGIQSLKIDFINGNQDLTWEDFHKNYLTSVEKYKNHENWNTYVSGLILFQMERTSILENINENNYTILIMYLEELKPLNNPYPKFQYQMLSTLKPFIAKEKIASYAINIYKKGLAKKESEKGRAEEMTKGLEEGSPVYDLVKEALQKSYQENYITYLPKLKEFFETE